MTDPTLLTTAWLAAPAKLELPPDEIHVWRASLRLEPQVLELLTPALAPDERSRAARYVFPRDRESFMAARGILRNLLGLYLDQPAGSLEFEYGSSGKPAIRSGRLGDPSEAIRFNLSHAHSLALYAFARGREVGIDLERSQADFDGESVAQRAFSARELAELRALSPESHAEGFFVRWTRKEAYLKARGEGFQIPPDSVDLSSALERPNDSYSGSGGRWRLISFRPGPEMVAALAAVDGGGWRTRYLEWRLR